jgi:hypothetical protein
MFSNDMTQMVEELGQDIGGGATAESMLATTSCELRAGAAAE